MTDLNAELGKKIYKIKFDDEALEEWDSLDGSIRKKFLNKLRNLEKNPYSPSNALHGPLTGYYKIKLRSDGYRLVYSIEEDKIIIFVISVGKREDNEVYIPASNRV